MAKPYKFTVLRTNGTEEIVDVPPGCVMSMSRVLKKIGAEVPDTVNLRDGRILIVDDIGHELNKPVNAAATKLYHSVCKPGTTHQIRGDAAVCLDEDFA